MESGRGRDRKGRTVGARGKCHPPCPAAASRALGIPAEPAEVKMTPGDALELRITPRVRLAEAILFSVDYAVLRVGDTTFKVDGEGDASVLDLAGGTVQQLGAGIRYTSVPAQRLGRAWLPADVSLQYRRTLTGAPGTMGGGQFVVTASVIPRIW